MIRSLVVVIAWPICFVLVIGGMFAMGAGLALGHVTGAIGDPE